MSKRLFIRFLLSLCGIIFSVNAFASGGQIFNPFAFLNPASMMLTNKDKVSGGLGLASVRVRFNGSITPLAAPSFSKTGDTRSETVYYLPGFLAYHRFSPWLVGGFVFSTPYFTDLNFPKFGLAQFSTFITRVRTADLSPRIAIQLSKKFAIGAGFNATWLSIQLNNNVVIPVPTPLGAVFNQGEFINKVSDWAYGWDVGLMYRPFKGTILGATYYSRESHTLTGNSVYAPTSGFLPRTVSEKIRTKLPRPQTVVVRAFQALSKPFGLIGAFYWTDWSTLQQAVVTGLGLPAGPTTTILPFNYENAYRFDWGGRWAPDDKWVFILLGFFEKTPTVANARNLTLPEASSLGIVYRVSYNFRKHWQVGGYYGHRWFRHASLDSVVLGTRTVGESFPRSDFVGIDLTYQD
ncbi:MAG: outer membrane protein transport protein [Pseudomonadota bacterium]